MNSGKMGREEVGNVLKVTICTVTLNKDHLPSWLNGLNYGSHSLLLFDDP